ncbi:PC-esterase domain-containing protein 1B-like isoform X2 [Thunnus maccoyii]|nr:PC-esterase domain-containing protein 1B-like isoform X2 [Thunnus maccoyii]XP_042256793.1 PC-esterase domain-containing protein 1B-like isoform X2 [Thunnus maccoyii]XP_042256794.1 PC-esterase domain-containing protein 1B-like isoform X2 [Thunnus maccoyii]XP_042256795.1 PC-esterase domain-containing protein 1B-like isoform X2 [Thunnus maccoyii]XP_042256796.1 PC-esterase domain-containing protein 1B-like isoform X2 [Thunnus maccoyii]XP_042256797.1 PC-esterase domain-containing protein 1B-like
MRTFVTRSQARQLLHNKFVVVLGGSVQRSMYKDLVLLLQRDQYLTLPQLKSKGELSFERDSLVEGGRLGPMTNGTEYREVRQYRSDHHLLRFYFLTRIYSPYVESILEDFQQGLKPDVIVISSCVWDITRYGLECFQQYKENLHKFFGQIKTIVCHECLILWTLAMPLGKKIKGGFLVPEISHLGPTVCYDIIEANLYSGRLADAYGLDILDLHFHFRLNLQNRMPDGVHWDALAHRRISSLLLQHAADAWGVQLPHPPFPPGQVCQGYRRDFGHHSFRPEWPHPRPPLDSGALQRQTLVQYEQNHLRSHNFHFAPPNTANIRPLLAPTQHANHHHPAQTDGHHYRALHFHCQQNTAGFGISDFHSPPPVHPHPPPCRSFPAAGDWTHSRQYYNPLPPTNLWRGQQVHHQTRAICSQTYSRFSAGGGFRFCPPFQADDRCVRMRRWRPHVRAHPYSPHLPLVGPRHHAYRW